MTRLLPVLAIAALIGVVGGCAPLVAGPGGGGRIISTDYCADQMLLALVPQRRIAGVSPDADDDRWFAAPRARDLPRVRPSFEAIMAHRPAVVLRAYGGDAALVDKLVAAGVKVIAVPSGQSLGDAAAALRLVGGALDALPAAEARLKAAGFTDAKGAAPERHALAALYLTPGSVTTGPDGFVADVMKAGGAQTIRRAPGWGPVPLERVLTDPPRLVVRGFFDDARSRQDRWSVTRHPALARTLAGATTVDVPGAWLACGNWLGGHAARAIRDSIP